MRTGLALIAEPGQTVLAEKAFANRKPLDMNPGDEAPVA